MKAAIRLSNKKDKSTSEWIWGPNENVGEVDFNVSFQYFELHQAQAVD